MDGFRTMAERISRDGRKEQSAPTSDEAIRSAEIRSALAGSIKDQQLMFDEDRLGNYGTDAAATRESDDGREEMDEKDRKVAHFSIVARTENSRNSGQICNSPCTRGY